MWTKTYGGVNRDDAVSVEETSDSGYIIVGNTRSFGAEDVDIWLIKTDRNGDTLWSRAYGGEKDDQARYVGQTSDGGYVLIGGTYEPSDASYIWSIKTDSVGDSISSHVFSAEEYNNLYAANRAHGSGFILIGYVPSIYENSLCFIRIAEDGTQLWTSEYYWEEGFEIGPWAITSIQAGHDMSYALTGSAYSDDPSSGPDYWISGMVLDPFGYAEEVWMQIDTAYDDEFSECIKPTEDGGYIVTANCWTLRKTNEVGEEVWTRTYDGEPNYVIPTADAGYLVTGSKDGDLWLLKTDANGDTVTVGVEEHVIDPPVEWSVVSPIGGRIRLRYTNCPQGFHASIFDASGRRVDELKSPAQNGTLTWGENHSPGVYFIRELTGSTETRKVILIE